VTWVIAACGLVATLQGAAWISGATGLRRAAGTALAVLGIVLLCGGVVHGLVPAFLAG
jgi:hypothetical protein